MTAGSSEELPAENAPLFAREVVDVVASAVDDDNDDDEDDAADDDDVDSGVAKELVDEMGKRGTGSGVIVAFGAVVDAKASPSIGKSTDDSEIDIIGAVVDAKASADSEIAAAVATVGGDDVAPRENRGADEGEMETGVIDTACIVDAKASANDDDDNDTVSVVDVVVVEVAVVVFGSDRTFEGDDNDTVLLACIGDLKDGAEGLRGENLFPRRLARAGENDISVGLASEIVSRRR